MFFLSFCINDEVVSSYDNMQCCIHYSLLEVTEVNIGLQITLKCILITLGIMLILQNTNYFSNVG